MIVLAVRPLVEHVVVVKADETVDGVLLQLYGFLLGRDLGFRDCLDM